jgi:hypothetical protein
MGAILILVGPSGSTECASARLFEHANVMRLLAERVCSRGACE